MARTTPPHIARKFQQYLCSKKTVALLKQCVEAPPSQQKAIQTRILANATCFGRFKDKTDWLGFISTSLSLGLSEHGELQLLLESLKEVHMRPKATHQKKRKLVSLFDIQKCLGSVLDTIKTKGFDDASSWLQSEYSITLVLRECFFPATSSKEFPGRKYHHYKKRQHLIEAIGKKSSNTILCNPSTGFLVIPPSESVIVVSKTSTGYELELVVIRNVPSGPAEVVQPLLSWLNEVISVACDERRNVRPTHIGCMVQVGLNMGPRHARVLGWAKSFTKKLSHTQMVQDDQDLIGGMSLFWALVKANIPLDIVKPIQDLLDQGFPLMASRNIPKGNGFTIEVDGVSYTFNKATRAPPEGYATMNYEAPTHVDPADEIKWSFGWTISRTALENQVPEQGGNLVDLGLKVLVQNSTGTLTAFKPEALHGTTDRQGVQTSGISLTFSRRVAVAYKEFAEKGACIDASCAISDVNDQ